MEMIPKVDRLEVQLSDLRRLVLIMVAKIDGYPEPMTDEDRLIAETRYRALASQLSKLL